MITIRGESPDRSERELDVWFREDSLRLYIHSPGNRQNGWQINLPMDEIRNALQRLGDWDDNAPGQ